MCMQLENHLKKKQILYISEISFKAFLSHLTSIPSEATHVIMMSLQAVQQQLASVMNMLNIRQGEHSCGLILFYFTVINHMALVQCCISFLSLSLMFYLKLIFVLCVDAHCIDHTVKVHSLDRPFKLALPTFQKSVHHICFHVDLSCLFRKWFWFTLQCNGRWHYKQLFVECLV